MADKKTYRYFKLGVKATLFTDAKSGLDVTNRNMTKIESSKIGDSKEVNEAIQKGHLIEVYEPEYEKWFAKYGEGRVPAVEDEDEDDGEEDEDDPESWTKAKLLAWIEDEENGVQDEDIETARKKGISKKDLVTIVQQYKD